MTPFRQCLLMLAIRAILWTSAAPLEAAEPRVSELMKQLGSSDRPSQVEAIDLLGRRGEAAKEAVPKLTELLGDRSPLVRAHAAQALGSIGAPAKTVTEKLVALVGDDDKHVRRAAVRALGHIRPEPETTMPLFVKMMTEADPSVRLHAMNAVAELGADAVPFLVKAVEDDEAAYWSCLVISEIGAGAEKAVPALVERLKDRRPEVRREAMLALAAIGKASAPAAPQLARLLDRPVDRVPATYTIGMIGKVPENAEKKIEENARSDDELLAGVSMWALAKLHPDDKEMVRKAVERLVAGLKNDEERVRRAAAQALVDLDPAPEIARPILAKAMDDASPEALDAMMDAPAGLGGKAVPRLIKALEVEQSRGRAAAIIERIGPAAKEAVPALIRSLTDKNPRTRSEVLLALGAIGPDAAAATSAISRLLEDPEIEVGYAACYALGKIGPAAAPTMPELTRCLKAENEFLRMASAWALAMIDPKSPETAAQAVPVLVEALNAPDAMTRLHAADALGRFGSGGRSAADKLKRLAEEDPHEHVRAAAAESLKATAAR